MRILAPLNGLLSEMRRRNVFRVALAYAVTAWVVIQVADTIFPRLQLPTWAVTLVIVLALLGFPISLVLAWAFELTPAGVRRETGRSEQPAPEELPPGLDEGAGSRASFLPPEPTPFIGRGQELAQLSALLADPASRLVTITGPGGIGKSRLALHLAHELAPGFPDGARYIPLGNVAAARFLAQAITEQLGLGGAGGEDPRLQLLRSLRGKRLLLVLDNFEHLIEGSTLVAELLEHAPQLRVLVTSRERLTLQVETVFPLMGMEVVSAASQPGEAVELFLCGAKRYDSRTRVQAEEMGEVVRICRAVEGVPLALELASAWTGTLSFQEIAEQIEHNRDFLHGSARDFPERHRSLRAAFEWSWRLLSEADRAVFRRLAVFRGGFRRRAAEQVAGASLESLSSLIDKSLVRRAAAGTYLVPEMLRQYAEERLRESPQEHQRTQRLHGEYYADLLAGATERLHGAEQRGVLQELDAEMANLRTAWRWAVEERRADLLDRAATALYTLYNLHGWTREGCELFAAGVAALRPPGAVPDVVAAKLMIREARFREEHQRAELGKVLLMDALPTLRGAGEQTEVAHALVRLGSHARRQGNPDESLRHLSEGLEIFRALGDEVGIASAMTQLGSLAYSSEEFARAEELWLDSLARYRACGRRAEVAMVLNNLGGIAVIRGQYTEATRLILEGLAIDRELENRLEMARSLHNLGYTCLQAGEYRQAERYLSEGLELSGTQGFRCKEIDFLDALGDVFLARGELNAAEGFFLRALAAATEIDEVPQLLEVLCGFGILQARAGARASAVEILTLVAAHANCRGTTRSRAESALRDVGVAPGAGTQASAASELPRLIGSILERRLAGVPAIPEPLPGTLVLP